MVESGYDFSESQLPGYVIDAKPYGPNSAQKMVQKEGDKTVIARISLSYMPSQPMKISRWGKDKWSFTKHNMAKEARNGKGDNGTSSLKSLVFDRLQPSTPHQRPSVFKRMGRNKTPNPSVFQRLEGGK